MERRDRHQHRNHRSAVVGALLQLQLLRQPSCLLHRQSDGLRLRAVHHRHPSVRFVAEQPAVDDVAADETLEDHIHAVVPRRHHHHRTRERPHRVIRHESKFQLRFLAKFLKFFSVLDGKGNRLSEGPRWHHPGHAVDTRRHHVRHRVKGHHREALRHRHARLLEDLQDGEAGELGGRQSDL